MMMKLTEKRDSLQNHSIDIQKIDPVEFRVERKFVPINLPGNEVNWAILSNPAIFQPAFPDRYVNNIYLDSGNICSYMDGAIDAEERGKYRVRWYGKSFKDAQKPMLEFKAKKNYFGAKIRFPIPAFNFGNLSPSQITRALLKGSDVPETMKSLLAGYKPVLLNRYLRSYFKVPLNNIMITVDRDVLVSSVRLGKDPAWRRLRDTVVEMKYPPSLENEAREIMSLLPFRLTKNSKFMLGIETFCR
jgi:hypothetical protein